MKLTPPRRPVVYFVQRSSDGLVKIGYSANLEQRLHRLRMDTGCDLEVLGALPGDRALERAVHRRLADSRVNGEWFKPTAAAFAIARGDVEVEALDPFAGLGPVEPDVANRISDRRCPPRQEMRRNILHCYAAGHTASTTARMLGISVERIGLEIGLMRAAGDI